MTRHSTRSHRALVAGAIALTAGFALSGCSILGSLTGEDDVFSIAVGDCLNDSDVSGEVSTVPIVDCAEPHDSEAYYAENLADGDFPGDDAVIAAADEICLEQFEPFAGISYDESVYDVSYYFPTEESWANGDREILCIIYDPNGQVTGSLAGIAS